MIPMRPFVRALARVDAEGRIALPLNVQRSLGLKHNQVLELRTVGTGRLRRLMLEPRNSR
jgi:bifunctional DNA-binding transcriptional regulator/antitoxin component of YhaV-PrlF toxin-antitoxin module